MTVADRIRFITQCRRAKQKSFALLLLHYDILAPMENYIRSEAFARRSVFVLFAFLPFFFVPVQWVSVAQAKIIFATVISVVAFLAWLSKSLRESRFRVPFSPLLLAAVLIPVAHLISAFATGASWGVFFGQEAIQDTVVGSVVWYIILLLSAAVLSTGQDRTLFALRSLIFGSSMVLLVQIVHLAIPSFTFGGVLPIDSVSIVGSWHDLAIFLGLTAFVSIAFLGTQIAVGYWRYMAFLNALAAVLFLTIINYSDVWIGLFFACIFYAFFVYKTRVQGESFFPIMGVMWLVFAALTLGLYFGGSVIHAALPVRLQVTQTEVRPSWQGTFAIGQKVFAEPGRIFFGSGPGTFSREWGLYKPSAVNTTQFWNVDFYNGVGLIPTSVVTMGILGLLSWGAVCVGLLWSLWKWLRIYSSETIVYTTLMASSIYLAVFHVLYVPGPLLSLITFLIFGALVAEEMHRGVVRERIATLSFETWTGSAGAILVSIFGLLVLFMGVQSIRASVSDIFVNQAIVEYNSTQNIQAASRSISLAVMVLGSNDRAHRAGVELGFLQLSKMIAEGGDSDEVRAKLQETLNSTIRHGLAAVSIEDQNYQNWLTLARLYGELAGIGVAGAENSARSAYTKVLQNNPTSPLPYMGLAQLDLAGKNEVDARKNLESAIAIKPDFAAAHFLLSQIHARANDLVKAEQHAAAVVQIAPEDPLGWYNLGTIFYTRGNNQNAALALERATTLSKDYANALFLLGLSYERLGRHKDALTSLKLVAKSNPGDKNLAELISGLEAEQDPDILR